MATAAIPLSEFDRAVRRVVRAIPKGQVSSYSQVAQRAGRPGGARHVASALRRLRDVPWWRVIQAGGTLQALPRGEAWGHHARDGALAWGRGPERGR